MLIIFDVDGTLCDTSDVDAACYAEAIEQVTGRSLPTVDWSGYQEATNAAIAREFLKECGEHEIESRERQIREEFVRRLEDKGRRNPELFRPVDGGLEIVAALRRKNYGIAIATGCWRESAHTKLRLSGFDFNGIPFASSSDARRRADIIALAAERAGCTISDSLYVGDGVWDVKAARELGMRFIGIGRKRELLREHGACRVLDSFRDGKAFFDALRDPDKRGRWYAAPCRALHDEERNMKHIQKLTVIRAAGSPPKQIEEFIGRVNSQTSEVSIARMTSPAGWTEPGQTTEFNEYTVVLKGTLRVKLKEKELDVPAGRAIVIEAGEWVQYSTPYAGGAEYIAVCLPAFSPENVHRDIMEQRKNHDT